MYNNGVRGICCDKGLMIEMTAFDFLLGETGGRCTGGGKRGGQEVGFPRSQEVGEKGKIMQHGTIFYNQKSTKWGWPTKIGH